MKKKSVLLILGIIFDLVGMISYLAPGFGEVIDFIWAPISAIAMFTMYRGAKGAIGGILGGIEEITPGLDFIPSFTIMWFYTYYIEKKVVVQEVKG